LSRRERTAYNHCLKELLQLTLDTPAMRLGDSIELLGRLSLDMRFLNTRPGRGVVCRQNFYKLVSFPSVTTQLRKLDAKIQQTTEPAFMDMPLVVI
jgi:hypothetical protein